MSRGARPEPLPREDESWRLLPGRRPAPRALPCRGGHRAQSSPAHHQPGPDREKLPHVANPRSLQPRFASGLRPERRLARAVSVGTASASTAASRPPEDPHRAETPPGRGRGRSFGPRSSLAVHQINDSGEKPHQCTAEGSDPTAPCAELPGRPGSLECGQRGKSFNNAPLECPPEPTTPRERPCQCPQCGRSFLKISAPICICRCTDRCSSHRKEGTCSACGGHLAEGAFDQFVCGGCFLLLAEGSPGQSPLSRRFHHDWILRTTSRNWNQHKNAQLLPALPGTPESCLSGDFNSALKQTRL